MTASLSVILPVFNAQSRLGPIVAQLLEVLPELTREFELVVVNDGSTDATDEVARELALDYPQICVVTHPARLGRSAAIRGGFARSSGGSVLLVDEDCRLHLSEIHKLWRYAPSHDVIVARPAWRSSAGRIPRPPAHKPAPRPVPPSPLQLVHRRVLKNWLASGTAEDLLAYLGRHGYPFHEVLVRELDQPRRAGESAEALGRRLGVSPPTSRLDKAAAKSLAVDPQRPNYLARLRAFALGE